MSLFVAFTAAEDCGTASASCQTSGSEQVLLQSMAKIQKVKESTQNPDAVEGSFVATNGKSEELSDEELDYIHGDADCLPGEVMVDDECELCAAGKASDLKGEQCLDCEVGKYADGEGNSVCFDCPSETPDCPPDFIPPTPAPTTKKPKREKKPCRRGKEPWKRRCIPCQPGYYSDETSFEPCKPCPINTKQVGKNFKKCFECGLGFKTEGEASTKCVEDADAFDENCQDSVPEGVKDLLGNTDPCSEYTKIFKGMCGFFDTADFKAKEMCCNCGKKR